MMADVRALTGSGSYACQACASRRRRRFLPGNRIQGDTLRPWSSADRRRDAWMSTLRMGPIGVTLDVAADGGHLADAAEVERLGYAAIWLPGGQLDRLDRI